uniref:C3H1-type domain-containing protein n=1 Tax=Caenorhabditis japonica TaxID=281687 RepID=A0A8R1DIZ6_CAEJA
MESSSSRCHAPLCRTTAGQRVLNPQNIPIPTTKNNGSEQMVPFNNCGPSYGQTQGPLPGLALLSFNDFDSCYSSCDDVSHPTLSRESSDASKVNDDQQGHPVVQHPPPEILEFAIKLGYTEEQLNRVLNIIGADSRMDDILSELVKLGLPTESVSHSSQEINKWSGRDRYTAPQSYFPTNSLLRAVVVDGSNVAMLHGRKEVFSCAGLRACLNFFLERGHSEVLIIIPQYRREQPRSDSPITDQHILKEIERHIIYTPSRNLNGRRVVCHDDRYILRTAELKDAVIVSNDEYRDLTRENPAWRSIVEERLLMFTFVDDKFMPPDDPSGKNGPCIDSFLSKIPLISAKPLICPYARKCTYGNKCKFFHPERPNGQHISVTERLMKENQQKKSLHAVKSMQNEIFKNKHASLARTKSLNVVRPLSEDADQLVPTLENQRVSPLHYQLQQANSAPWMQQQHAQKHESSPLTPINQQQTHYNKKGYATMPFIYSPGVIGGQRLKLTTNVSQTQLYTPSTAVWGHSELSVGPLNPG